MNISEIIENGITYLVEEYTNGAIVKYPKPSIITKNYIYVHTTITGGDGLSPIGIKNDNIQSLTVSIDLRVSEVPTSSLLPISAPFRVEIRDDKNNIYDMILIDFINGQTTLVYKTSAWPATCSINQSDLEDIDINGTTYSFVLVNPIKFKVYRVL